MVNMMWKSIIGLTVLLLGLALAGPVFALELAQVKSCDEFGNKKEIFLVQDDMYVRIKTSGHGSLTVRIYVVENSNWQGGEQLIDVSDNGYDEYTFTSSGWYVIKVWSRPLKVGEYDIIVDEDLDGIYDPQEKCDITGVRPGVFVIPELPLGSLMAVMIYFGVLVGLSTKRLRLSRH